MTNQATQTVDAKGLTCPMHLLKAKKYIARINSGQILEVIGDDLSFKMELYRWCETSGHEYQFDQEDSDGIHIFIKKA